MTSRTKTDTLPRQPLRLAGADGVARGTLLGPLIFLAVIESAAQDFDNRCQMQTVKCKVTFTRNPPVPCTLRIEGQHLKVCDSMKILVVMVEKDLQWGEQVATMVKKSNSKPFLLHYFNRFHVIQEDLMTICTSYTGPPRSTLLLLGTALCFDV